MGSEILALRGDRVQIESFPDDFRGAPLTKISIEIPDAYKEPSRLGKIIAVGDGWMHDDERGRYQHQFSVKVGDIVLCTRYPKTGTGVKFRGSECFFMREIEILGKVEITNGANR